MSAGSLVTIQKSHALPETRVAAGDALVSLLEGSRQYLSIADDSSRKNASFMTLSQKTADFVYMMHELLLDIISTEEHSAALSQDLKVGVFGSKFMQPGHQCVGSKLCL